MTINPPVEEGESWGYCFQQAPTPSDSAYPLHTIAFTTEGKLFILTDNSPGKAKWVKIGGQRDKIDTGWFVAGDLSTKPPDSFGGVIKEVSFLLSRKGVKCLVKYDDLGYKPTPQLTIESLSNPEIDNDIRPPILASFSSTQLECFLEETSVNKSRSIKVLITF